MWWEGFGYLWWWVGVWLGCNVFFVFYFFYFLDVFVLFVFFYFNFKTGLTTASSAAKKAGETLFVDLPCPQNDASLPNENSATNRRQQEGQQAKRIDNPFILRASKNWAGGKTPP